MDITTLENWLWDAACSIRGTLDAPKFKDYILPFLFYKRLSDVYDDEIARLSRELGFDTETATQIARVDRKLIRFYIPEGCHWNEVRANANKLGERLTDAMRSIAGEPKAPRGVALVDDKTTTGVFRSL